MARWQGGKKSALAEQLHVDHGVIVSLLAPPPSLSILLTIRSILEVHNALEEGQGGLYQNLQELAGPEAEKLLADFKGAPAVRVLPNNEKPEVLEAAKKAVTLAGYEFKIAVR
jgi:hypothetical protein